MIAPKARERAMMAGGLTEVETPRDAAIVGAIVRCCIATGRWNGPWIAQAAVDAITDFNLVGVSRVLPGNTELQMVRERFAVAYGREFTD